jgi:Asp-tRNA(Asn)/Glu-tRNA(Gln) amidotransferase B subunit
LEDLLGLVKDNKVSVANGKDLMMRVIDGESELPSQIAQSLGYIGDAITDQEVQQAVDSVLDSNAAIVDKILNTGKTGPIMALVGKVMQ